MIESIVSCILNVGGIVLTVLGVKLVDDYDVIAAIVIGFGILLLFVSYKVYSELGSSRSKWYNIVYWGTITIGLLIAIVYGLGFYKKAWDSPALNTPIGGEGYVEAGDSWNGEKPDTWDYNHDGKLDEKEMSDYQDYMNEALEYGKNH